MTPRRQVWLDAARCHTACMSAMNPSAVDLLTVNALTEAGREVSIDRLRTIAAYRDRYGITGSDPLGPAPSSQGQRLDRRPRRRRRTASTTTVSDDVRRRHGPEKQIDSGRDLSR